jgi:hypothetical protein
MFAGRLTQATIRGLDWCGQQDRSRRRTCPRTSVPAGAAKETRIFTCRRGHAIIARNYRSPQIAANSILPAGIGTSCVLSK